MKKFRSRADGPVKVAFLNDEAASYIKPSWSSNEFPGLQTFKGPHMVVLMERAGAEPISGLKPMDVYGCDITEWLETHVRVKGGWRKSVIVEAFQLDKETNVTTMLGTSDVPEAVTTAPAGHWVVRNPRGEIYVNTPEQFSQQYVPVE